MSVQPLPTLAALAATIDYSVLGENATRTEVLSACVQARERGYASVCVRPKFVRFVAESLHGSLVKTCTVISFPRGNHSIADKEAEARQAIADGATEVDWVFGHHNVVAGAGDERAITQEAQRIALLAEVLPEVVFKIIIETYLLNDEQKRSVCELLAKSFGRVKFFLKTSTGFAEPRVPGDHIGATVEDVTLMLEVGRASNPNVEAKASGGIKTLAAALAMLNAGATRLGMGTSGADAIMAEAAAAGWQ
jgi:deoxyribose-phosphate aldolase